jgi:hypothetical protein
MRVFSPKSGTCSLSWKKLVSQLVDFREPRSTYLWRRSLAWPDAGCDRIMCPQWVSTAVAAITGAEGTANGVNALAARFWGKWAGACGIGFQAEPEKKGNDGTGGVASEGTSAGKMGRRRGRTRRMAPQIGGSES